MTALAYKRNASDAMARLHRLWNDRAQDLVLATFDIPSPTVERFRARYPAGFCDYPDPIERIRFWDDLLQERAGLTDDSIPSAYLTELDQGLYGGVLGGDVRFLCDPNGGWISSMVPPLLRDWAQFDSLRIDESHPWFDRYRRQLDVFTAGADGKFGISHLILIDGMNFVFELVGATNAYLSLLERPETVRRAIDFAFDLNVRVQRMFFDAVHARERGTFSNMVQWVPGRVVSESVDPFHMTSVDYFERWGREPVQRIFDEFDGGVLHLHGNGRHLLEAVSTLRGLKAIYLGDDKGFAPAHDVLEELKRRAGGVPLVLGVPFGDFTRRLERGQLVGGVLYRVSGAPSVDEANRWMERVRAYRA